MGKKPLAKMTGGRWSPQSAGGSSPRKVAERLGVSLRTVQVRVARAGGQRPDRIDWSDRPRGGRREGSATPARSEDPVVRVRKDNRETSALGDCGAGAIALSPKENPVMSEQRPGKVCVASLG